MGSASIDGPGSTWTVGNELLYIGCDGGGAISITNGGSVSSPIGVVARDPGSIGVATVDGVGSVWTCSLLGVADFGSGTLSITRGGLVTTGNGYISSFYSSNGLVKVDGVGSAYRISGNLLIAGTYGMGNDTGTYNGTLSITNGGSVTCASDIYVATPVHAAGMISVDGAGSAFVGSGGIYLGGQGPSMGFNYPGGTATLSITGGGSFACGSTGAFLGYLPASVATVTVDGTRSTLIDNGALAVGYSGAGTLSISHGGNVSDPGGSIGNGLATVDGVGLVLEQ